MNKQIRKLFGLMLVCSAALKADADTNLTFVSIGGQRNVAERNMLTQRIAMRKDKGMGGTLQAVPFFKQSSNGQKLAEALSSVGKQTTSFGGQASGGGVIIQPNNDANIVNVFTKPQHREFGVHLAWQQRLDLFLEGLFFEIDAPILNVRHQINPVFSGQDATTLIEVKRLFLGAPNGLNGVLQNNYKMYTGSQSKTGVADVALKLCYSFIESEDSRFAVNLAVVAPTGGKPTSDFMFKPVIGDNNAWALGVGATLSGKLYENGDHEFRGVIELNYRYRFANTQERTLGLKMLNGSQFILLSDGVVYLSAANYLTTDLKVTGGSAVNLLAGLGYDYKAFSFDAAYELNGWAAESAELASTSDFKEDATIQFAGTNPVYNVPANPGVITLVKSNLDFAPATNPSKLTHKLAGSLGYTFSHDQEYPVALGVGGSYTFGSNRSAFQGWGVFGKLGVSF